MGEEVKDSSGTKTRNESALVPSCHPVVILDL